MKNMDISIVQTALPLGSIAHYKHYVNEFERIKELAKNATGNKADELYLELDGILMILEKYEF